VDATRAGGDLSRRAADAVVAAGFAIAGFAVTIAPAVLMRSEVLNAGIGSLDDDVLAASVAVGAVEMVLAWRRVRNQERTAARRLHVWIASFNALVVLALTASLLLLLALYLFPDEHASLANRGFPVFALWAGVQAVAVVLAEATGWLFFSWLRPDAP
jgi:hypothetical protein